MLKGTYDVVIAGTDLPALVFGALAAKKGYRVLVLGHGGKENAYEVDGYRFVRRPNLLCGFSDSNPIREVFRELALAPEMRNLPRPMTPSCHVVLPDARVELTHIRDILDREIEREYAGRLPAFRDFTDRLVEVEKALEPLLRDTPTLPPGTIKEYLSFRRYRKGVAPLLAGTGTDALAPFAGDPRLRTLLAAPVAAMSGLARPWETPLPFIRLANHLLRGLYHVEWGDDALKALFLARIRGNSGDVRPGDRVDMLVVSRGTIREVEIQARNESVGAGMLVAGSDLGALLDLVPSAHAKRRYRTKVARRTPSHYGITLNIGTHRSVIPEGMAQIAFLVADPAAPLEGENLLTLQVDPAMEPLEARDPDRVVLSVTGWLPADRFDGEAATLQAFADRMLEGARRLIPFLGSRPTTLSVSSIETSPKTGLPVVDPAGLIPVYPDAVPRSLDLMTWPVRTPYRNLLNLGDCAAGALGFEGAFLSAFMAFNVLRARIPLKTVM
jgi:phytoene dehydrogenase-like protein